MQITLTKKKECIKGINVEKFYSFKIIENADLRLDEFRFVRSKDDGHNKEMALEKIKFSSNSRPFRD